MIAEGRIDWTAPGPTPSTSAHDMLGRVPATRPVLITTADHPLLTAEIVDHFCRDSLTSGCDVVIGLAPHDLVRATFPDLKKTVLRFRDGNYCGCNLFAFLTEDGRQLADFWRRVERDRKKPLVVIRLLGSVVAAALPAGLAEPRRGAGAAVAQGRAEDRRGDPALCACLGGCRFGGRLPGAATPCETGARPSGPGCRDDLTAISRRSIRRPDRAGPRPSRR